MALVEFIHSSEIIEFFVFFLILSIFIMTCLRILIYHDNFNIPEESTVKKSIPVPETESIKSSEEKQKENVINMKSNNENEGKEKNENNNEKKEAPPILPVEIKNDMNGSNVILGEKVIEK